MRNAWHTFDHSSEKWYNGHFVRDNMDRNETMLEEIVVLL